VYHLILDYRFQKLKTGEFEIFSLILIYSVFAAFAQATAINCHFSVLHDGFLKSPISELRFIHHLRTEGHDGDKNYSMVCFCHQWNVKKRGIFSIRNWVEISPQA